MPGDLDQPQLFVDGDNYTGAEVNAILQALLIKARAVTSGKIALQAIIEELIAVKAVTPSRLSDESRSLLNGFKNRIINGRFDFARRDNSVNNPASGTFCFDRWRIQYDGTGATHNCGVIGSNLVGYPTLEDYAVQAMRWLQSGASTGDTYRYIEQRIEDARTFSAQNVTVSFFGAITSGRSYTVEVVRNYGTGGSPSATEVLYITTINGASGWAKQELTFAMTSVQGKSFGSNADHYIGLRFKMPLNTDFDFYLALVQFELGSVASAFEQRQIPVERELCNRYFIKSFRAATEPAQNVGNNTGEQMAIAGKAGAGAQYIPIAFPTPMRTVPTVTTYNPAAANAQVRDVVAAADCSAVTVSNATERGVLINATGNGSTAVGNLLSVHWTADAEL